MPWRWRLKADHSGDNGYINAKAKVTLRNYLATRDDDCEYLFVSERKPIREIKPAAIEKIVRNIYIRTDRKIPKHVTPHVLRHTTATMAMQSGMPIVDISKLLGHEKVDTTMIYAHVASADVQTGHRKHVV